MKMNTTMDVNVTDISPFNTTLDDLLNTTTARPRAAGGPPPPGYYGDVRETLWTVIPPIIITVGTVGNILTILVLIRQMKWSSTALYLLALALSDLVILYSGPLRNWIRFEWEKDIRYLSDSGCKAQIYLTYCSIQFSSWLLVAVTWERAISVLVPHKVRLCCSPQRAGVVIITLLVIIFGIDMVLPVIISLEGAKKLRCAPSTAEYLKFRDDVFVWLDFLVAFCLPFVLLLVGNIIIIVQLWRSQTRQRAMTVSHGGKTGSNSNRDTRSISILMVMLCFIFLTTMTPVSVYQIYYPYAFEKVLELYKTNPIQAWYDYQYLLYLHAVFNLVGYTNAAFNFLLYVFSGSKFRSELVAMFRCARRRDTGAFGSSKNTGSSGKTKLTITSTKESGIYMLGSDGSTDKRNNGVIESSTFSDEAERNGLCAENPAFVDK